jgi:hypothetical protein
VLSPVDERNTSVEHWWNDAEEENPKVVVEKRVPGPLVPTQIPYKEAIFINC